MKYSTTSLLLGTVLTTFVFSDAEDAGNLTQYLEFGRRGVVNCAFEEDFFFIAWFNSTNTEEEPLLIMQNSVKSGRGYFSGEFDMNPNGSLIINKVNFQHDHPFRVVTLKQLTSVATMTVIHVVVTVPPDPPYPVVEGCRNDQYCVLGVGREGVVTCSLRRIRPHVELRFTTFRADSMEFWDQLLSVEAVEHNGTVTFDIRLTSRFTINVPLLNRVTVQCHTSGYEFSTWFDLLYNTDPSSTTHDGDVSLPPTTYSRQNPTRGSSLLLVLIGTTLAATILIITIIGIVYYNARPGSKMEDLQNL